MLHIGCVIILILQGPELRGTTSGHSSKQHIVYHVLTRVVCGPYAHTCQFEVLTYTP